MNIRCITSSVVVAAVIVVPIYADENCYVAANVLCEVVSNAPETECADTACNHVGGGLHQCPPLAREEKYTGHSVDVLDHDADGQESFTTGAIVKCLKYRYCSLVPCAAPQGGEPDVCSAGPLGWVEIDPYANSFPAGNFCNPGSE